MLKHDLEGDHALCTLAPLFPLFSHATVVKFVCRVFEHGNLRNQSLLPIVLQITLLVLPLLHVVIRTVVKFRTVCIEDFQSSRGIQPQSSGINESVQGSIGLYDTVYAGLHDAFPSGFQNGFDDSVSQLNKQEDKDYVHVEYQDYADVIHGDGRDGDAIRRPVGREVI